jgi:hypothetical protein
MLQASCGLQVAGKRRELVWNDTYLPRFAVVRGMPRDLGRGRALVPGAEGAGFDKRRRLVRGPMSRQIFGTAGAFGGNDNPFLSEKILSQLRQRRPPVSLIG